MWRLMAVMGVVLGVVAASAQGPEVKDVMREKLLHQQKILEMVVTSDWVRLQTEIGRLEQLTQDPRWMVFRYPGNIRQSDSFLRAVRALRAAAAQRDLDKTPQAYVAVTLECVACHRYMARMRIAR